MPQRWTHNLFFSNRGVCTCSKSVLSLGLPEHQFVVTNTGYCSSDFLQKEVKSSHHPMNNSLWEKRVTPDPWQNTRTLTAFGPCPTKDFKWAYHDQGYQCNQQTRQSMQQAWETESMIWNGSLHTRGKQSHGQCEQGSMLSCVGGTQPCVSTP